MDAPEAHAPIRDFPVALHSALPFCESLAGDGGLGCGPGVGAGTITSHGLPLIGVCRVSPNLPQGLVFLKRDLRFWETETWKPSLLAYGFVT